jgi:zinc transport system substrate-binding protein
LDSLDRDCRRRLGAAPRREFVSLHAAFRYLASRYGLREVSVFETHMEEPGPGDLERVLGFVREARIKTIFVQPQLPAAHLAWLQEQAGLRVARLDPVGSPLQPGYDSYLAMMRSNIDALARGLGE